MPLPPEWTMEFPPDVYRVLELVDQGTPEQEMPDELGDAFLFALGTLIERRPMPMSHDRNPMHRGYPMQQSLGPELMMLLQGDPDTQAVLTKIGSDVLYLWRQRSKPVGPADH